MQLHYITSSSNQTLKLMRALQRRKEREQYGLFILEGMHCLQEALLKGIAIQHVVTSEAALERKAGEWSGLALPDVMVVPENVLKELSTTEGPCDLVACAKKPLPLARTFQPGSNSLIVVACGLQDPGNLGTLFRSAHAACASAVILTAGSVDAFNPKVVRAAAGSLFALPLLEGFSEEDLLIWLQERDIKPVICDAKAMLPCWDFDFTKAVALILGSEGGGVPDFLKDKNKDLAQIKIPMNPTCESLNVAVSGSILLFTALQQRLCQGNISLSE